MTPVHGLHNLFRFCGKWYFTAGQNRKPYANNSLKTLRELMFREESV